MPRKTPISTEEKEISARFRLARKAAGLSTAALAGKIGVDGARLRNYDAARHPVPFWIGQKIAMATDHCQRWLAKGKLPRKPAFALEQWLQEMIPDTMTFGAGYDVIAEDIDERFREASEHAGVSEENVESCVLELAPIGCLPSIEARRLMGRALDLVGGAVIHNFPLEIVEQFATEVRNLASRFQRQYKRQVAEFRESRVQQIEDERAAVQASFSDRIERLVLNLRK